jgi:hypothetical protein
LTQTRTVEEKVSDWFTAFNAIKHEITPVEFRPLLALMGSKDGDGNDNVQAINLGVAVARIVMANDRAAATVAALLTTNGVKPSGFEYGENPE